MRSRRFRVASKLLAGDTQLDHDSLRDQIDVLNSFELLGFLVHQAKVLTLKEAWSALGTYAIHYYYACDVKGFQKDDPTFYELYVQLAQGLVALDARQRGVSADEVVRESGSPDFLKSEVALAHYLTGAPERVWRLVDRWEQPAMLKSRRSAAAGLLRQPPSLVEEAYTVLDFFEVVAFLVRRGECALEEVWSTLGSFALAYDHASRAQVASLQEKDRTPYEDFGHLCGQLRDMKARRRKIGDTYVVTDDYVRAVLRGEEALPV